MRGPLGYREDGLRLIYIERLANRDISHTLNLQQEPICAQKEPLNDQIWLLYVINAPLNAQKRPLNVRRYLSVLVQIAA